MKIIINELKKIFNIKSILVLLLINFAVYFLRTEFYISVFPNGRPSGDDYRVAVKMIKEKGNSLKDEDIKYLYNLKENMLKEADNYLINSEEAKKLNIKNYLQFKEEKSEAFKKLNSQIMFKEGVNVFWELQSINGYIEAFEHRENKLNYIQSEQPQSKDRLETIRKNKSQNSILPWFVFENYNDLIRYNSIAVIISIVFMIAPIFTKDARNSLELLQYTAKRGRNLYKDKIKTALISSIIITTLQLGIIFFLYTTRPYSVAMFYNSNINSCFSCKLFWFDMTFIQYIILTVVLVYIVGMIVSLITCFVSRHITNYTALIGVLVPIFVPIIYITKSITLNVVGNLIFFKYKVPVIISVLVLVGIVLIVFRGRKEKKIDVML